MPEDIRQTLGRIEGKLDAFIDVNDQRHNVLSNRIDAVEKTHARVGAIAGFIGACASTAFALIGRPHA